MVVSNAIGEQDNDILYCITSILSVDFVKLQQRSYDICGVDMSLDRQMSLDGQAEKHGRESKQFLVEPLERSYWLDPPSYISSS